MRFVRGMVARTALSLALFAAGTALSTWWSSFLVLRAASGINAAVSVPQNLANQLPSTGTLVAAAGALGGSAGTLTVPGANGLSLDTDPQAKALAGRLRSASRWALLATAVLLPLALVVTRRPDLHKTLHRVGRWATWTGGVATLGTWIIPSMVAGLTAGGSAHSVAHTVASADAPGRMVAVVMLAMGLALLTLGRSLRRAPAQLPVVPPTGPVPLPAPPLASGI
ncbi:MAG TPA: hypothetical protein VMV14_03520 [Acidimicrobiales bacterium]|nr:hypothetical protein [Acidimicrobiales bacterium]